MCTGTKPTYKGLKLKFKSPSKVVLNPSIIVLIPSATVLKVVINLPAIKLINGSNTLCHKNSITLIKASIVG